MKNMRTMGIMALAGILSFTFIASDVMAALKDDQKGPRGNHVKHGGAHGGFGQAFAKLDNDKKALFFSIIEENKINMAPLRDQMWAKHAQLKAISDDTTTDMAVLTKITDDIVALRQQMRDAAVALDSRMAAELGIKTKFAMKALEEHDGKQGSRVGKHAPRDGKHGHMGQRGQDCKPEGKRGGHNAPCDCQKAPHGHKAPHGDKGPRNNKPCPDGEKQPAPCAE